MPIEFKTFYEDNYFLSNYAGDITDTEIINYYKNFFESKDWKPGANELADLRSANLGNVTSEGLIQVSVYQQLFLKKNNIESVHTAVVCQDDFTQVISRSYEQWSADSPEKIHIFTNLQDARNWLISL